MQKLQVTFEQHECELRRSTYMQVFSIYTTELHDLQLVESVGTEQRIQGTDHEAIHGLSIAQGWCS